MTNPEDARKPSDVRIRSRAFLQRTLEQELAQIYASRSWRLTKPVRRFSAKIGNNDFKADQVKPITALERELSDVYASRSWRFTAPLRVLERVLFDVYASRLGRLGAQLKLIPQALRHKPMNLYRLATKHASQRIRVFQRNKLSREYKNSKLYSERDTFVLFRIIGNDLYPRHKKGQSCENVKFILENEQPFDDCEKIWVINRIFDPHEEARIINLLEDQGQTHLRIPFDMREYRRTAWDFECFPEGFFLRGAYSELSAYDRARAVVRTYRYKNNYIMNNNGARNVALREGRRRAKWVLPWDGNCFVTEGGWRDLVEQIKSQPYLKYFIVPMARVTDNLTLINPDLLPDTTEEPQVAFRCDAENEFDEAFAYGRRPKVELLWRLGVPGPWDKWQDDPWDLPRPRRSKEASQFDRAGWVARLFSGRSDLETQSKQTLKNRGVARAEAIISTINHVEQESLRQFFDPMRLTSYSEDAVVALGKPGANKFETELLERLVKEANEALARGPYSVIDKTTLPPSGDRQDYWHPAPYWWPDENSADGLPYIWRDGVRVPGTQLYELESEKFDRTRLQRLFDDATILALAWKATGQSKYAKHGADLVRRWFIDPDTRMNPHLRYAQVIRGQNGDEGGGRGIIEMKDMYFFLDAVRLFCRGGMLDGREKTAFSDWLGEYLEWLLNSDQGRRERQAKNNHGTCFDLQVASIAAFLGNSEVLQATARDSQERLLEQFEPDGRQPHELKRTLTAHYVCFNLQSWANCALLAERCGQNLWDISDSGGRGLRKGFEWLSPFIAGTEWRWPQVEPFDVERYWPLYYHYVDHYGLLPSPERITAPPKLSVKPLYFPHDAIKPFWMLERYSAPEKLGKP